MEPPRCRVSFVTAMNRSANHVTPCSAWPVWSAVTRHRFPPPTGLPPSAKNHRAKQRRQVSALQNFVVVRRSPDRALRLTEGLPSSWFSSRRHRRVSCTCCNCLSACLEIGGTRFVASAPLIAAATAKRGPPWWQLVKINFITRSPCIRAGAFGVCQKNRGDVFTSPLLIGSAESRSSD